MSSSTMNPEYVDGNIKEILKRAKKIATSLDMYCHDNSHLGGVCNDTIVGIAAMIQLEVMNAPIIMVNNDVVPKDHAHYPVACQVCYLREKEREETNE